MARQIKQLENLKEKLQMNDPYAPVNRKRDGVLIGSTAVITIIILMLLNFFTGISIDSLNFGNNKVSTNEVIQQSSGKVALTEKELRAAVNTLGAVVYWTGPINGYKYSLENRAAGQIFVKYLPNGQGISDTAPKYRVIGTYTVKNAYSSTKAAGSAVANGIGLSNADGAVIYYNKNVPTNVYLAYEGKDQQIEIFDPSSGQALQLATTAGAVQQIK